MFCFRTFPTIASLASIVVGGCCGVAHNAQACVLRGGNEPNWEVLEHQRLKIWPLNHDGAPKIRKILQLIGTENFISGQCNSFGFISSILRCIASYTCTIH